MLYLWEWLFQWYSLPVEGNSSMNYTHLPLSKFFLSHRSKKVVKHKERIPLQSTTVANNDMSMQSQGGRGMLVNIPAKCFSLTCLHV